MNSDNTPDFLIVGCGILKNEIQVIIARNGWNAEQLFVCSSLHIHLERLERTLTRALDSHPSLVPIVLYGECHPRMDKILEDRGAIRLCGRNCVEFLIGPEEMDRHLSQGAFFLLEDWVRRWKFVTSQIANEEIMGQILLSSHSHFVALRTPASTDFSEKAEALAKKMNIPLVWLDTDLSHLEALLRSTVHLRKTLLQFHQRAQLSAQRADALARRKASLEALSNIYRSFQALESLAQTIDRLLQIVMNLVGSTEIHLHYHAEELWHTRSFGGEQTIHPEPASPEVAEVARLGCFRSYIVTDREPSEFSPATHDWYFPLATEAGVFAVLHLKGLLLPFEGMQGDLQGFLNYVAHVIFRQIHDTSRLSAELEENIRQKDALRIALDKAEEANRVKNEFVANMSHEIRTPLNGLVGAAALLQRMELSPLQQTLVHTISEGSEILIGLVEQVLDLSRLDNGKFVLRPEWVELQPFLNQMKEVVAGTATAKGLSLAISEEPAPGLFIWVDRMRLSQLVLNLLSNAIKFTDVGFVQLACSVTPAPVAGMVSVSLRCIDSGVGVSAGMEERIFEKFVQGSDSLTSKRSGLGLGLAIAKEIASYMNASLEYSRPKKGGSCFEFLGTFLLQGLPQR